MILRLTILGVLLSMFSAHAESANMASYFENMRGIQGPFSLGDQGRIAVPDDVFGQSRNFPHDLRILDDAGVQWPFFLYVPPASLKPITKIPKILNRSFVSGRNSYLQFELVLPQTGAKKWEHNQVELATSGHDFIRRVEVFSAEGRALMAVGHLIDLPRSRGAQNRTIRYPVSNADRLYIRIYTNAQRADESFSLSRVKLHDHRAGETEREEIFAVEKTLLKEDEVAEAQTYLFDLGQVHRPLDGLVFDVQTPSFARSISVYGRNASGDPWGWVGGGEIHSLEGDEDVTVQVNARHRYLKIHIFHHDDAPLAIQSIRLEAIPRYLVFEAASTEPARLYYRAWNLNAPRYDLKGRVPIQNFSALPIFKLQAAESNHTVNIQPWRKYAKPLGGLAVAAVSLLVLGVIASMLKQQKSEE